MIIFISTLIIIIIIIIIMITIIKTKSKKNHALYVYISRFSVSPKTFRNDGSKKLHAVDIWMQWVPEIRRNSNMESKITPNDLLQWRPHHGKLPRVTCLANRCGHGMKATSPISRSPGGKVARWQKLNSSGSSLRKWSWPCSKWWDIRLDLHKSRLTIPEVSLWI